MIDHATYAGCVKAISKNAAPFNWAQMIQNNDKWYCVHLFTHLAVSLILQTRLCCFHVLVVGVFFFLFHINLFMFWWWHISCVAQEFELIAHDSLQESGQRYSLCGSHRDAMYHFCSFPLSCFSLHSGKFHKEKKKEIYLICIHIQNINVAYAETTF